MYKIFTILPRQQKPEILTGNPLQQTRLVWAHMELTTPLKYMVSQKITNPKKLPFFYNFIILGICAINTY